MFRFIFDTGWVWYTNDRQFVLERGTSDSDSPIWLRIFWSVVITIVSIGLLLAGSFNSMQSAVVLCGLPFSVIILLYMFGLAKALKQDDFDRMLRKSS